VLVAGGGIGGLLLALATFERDMSAVRGERDIDMSVAEEVMHA
jgi:2-polyprenyl-6-methoxyphenol hydroxylase-like FAD-dependent oxidoreductase